MNRTATKVMCLALVPGMLAAVPAAAQIQPVLLRDSFPIGDGNGVLCQVQDRSVENPAKATMFDRAWAVVCRDSAQPVAYVYAFRDAAPDVAARVAGQRRLAVDCPQPAASLSSGSSRQACTVAGTSLGWTVLSRTVGGTTYIAEGFAAYDAATDLALRSVMDDSIASGTIDVASVSVSDPLSFARVQAETLKPEQALAEGYRRNLGGEYSEAAAYFETLQQRLAGERDDTISPGEFLVNRALQKSNMGDFAEANRLFAEAEPMTGNDPVTARLQRNFEAIHLLNQGFAPEALARLDRPVEGAAQGLASAGGKLAITVPLAARINHGEEANALLGFVDELKLTPQERAQIIDAQAFELRGTALRLDGKLPEAKDALLEAYQRAVAVRDGRVTSITRLRSQILQDLSLIAEREGKAGDAEAYLRNALELLQIQYPEKRAVSGAEARLAAFLLRQGRTDEAVTLYRGVVDRAAGKRDALTGIANQLGPYYRLLAGRADSDPQAAADLFKALQLLVRPGVAETQALLARELSAKSDDAARLFRQSLDLGRDIERARIRYETLGQAEQTAENEQLRGELASQIDRLEQDQLKTLAALSAFPQYRAVAPRAITLDEFRAGLKDGEAYARLAVVGSDMFVFYTDRTQAHAYRLDLAQADLDYMVDTLRASISIEEGGQNVTYPYDLPTARQLYLTLFGPVAGEMAGVHHLIFEPDGAMLRLPVEILVTDDASVSAYQARTAAGGDPFDFTGVAWLGRDREVSTAVSAQSFIDARGAPRSKASHEYLGLGHNQPLGDVIAPRIRAVLASGNDECGWTAAAWNAPISDAELVTARSVIGAQQSRLITGSAFSDDAIKADADLKGYRVLHFATHGLVTPPRPGCPVKPALLTSFGADGSDGLLTFEEIYNLSLDADLVILSACDTAGGVSIEATRAAGVPSGGGTALDGLVRAFIGAGGRAVIASHWPAPDEYQATERLMSEMFRRGATSEVGEALRESRELLMNDPRTSHPFYWGGFALIGDATRPLLTAPPPATAAATPTAPTQLEAGQ